MDGTQRIKSLAFSGHALRQMFARKLTTDEVKTVIDEGVVIASYPDDRPYPTELLLGFPARRALHVVLAYNEVSRNGYIVTAYVPDPKLWNEGFKTRRKP